MYVRENRERNTPILVKNYPCLMITRAYTGKYAWGSGQSDDCPFFIQPFQYPPQIRNTLNGR